MPPSQIPPPSFPPKALSEDTVREMRERFRFDTALQQWDALVQATVRQYRVRASALLTRRGRVSQQLYKARYMLSHAVLFLCQDRELAMRWLGLSLTVTASTLKNYFSSRPSPQELAQLLWRYFKGT